MSTTSLLTYHSNTIFTNAYTGGSRPMHHYQWQASTFSGPHRSSNRGSVGGGMRRWPPISIRCRGSSDSNPGRGFGPQQREDPSPSPNTPTPAKNKASKGSTTRESKGAGSPRKSVFQQPGSIRSQAPATSSRMDETSKGIAFDLEFEERLQAVRRSALDQKKVEEKNVYGAIDYDAPVASEPSKIGLGTKIGVGVAVVVFGLLFALGDFLPSGSVNTDKDAIVAKNTLSPEEKENLQTRLQQYEATLAITPDDPVAREGAAVTLTELGEFTRAASMLDDLTKLKPSDPEAYRLLGEVKYEMKDYEGSAAAYKSSAMMSKKLDFDVLRGRTNALLAAKKPDEAVQILLASRDSLEREKANQADTQSQIDPIQIELLLGKAYSDWGHVSDAVSVYDRLISSHPDDFRGYLAKGIILKANGKNGDAERMFIQARFFAPEGAKSIVDRYSRQ